MSASALNSARYRSTRRRNHRSFLRLALRPGVPATSLKTAVLSYPGDGKMKFRLTDKRKFNYLVLSLLALIVLVGVLRILIDIKVLA